MLLSSSIERFTTARRILEQLNIIMVNILHAHIVICNAAAGVLEGRYNGFKRYIDNNGYVSSFCMFDW